MAEYELPIDLTFEVKENVLSEPLNVLSCDVGDGSMEVSWDAPASGIWDHFDILISSASGGNFVKANVIPIANTRGKVYNLPFGSNVYTKVKAIDAIGTEGDLSSLAEDASMDKAIMTLRFIAPIGDIIADDSMFAAIISGELVAFKIDQGGAVSG